MSDDEEPYDDFGTYFSEPEVEDQEEGGLGLPRIQVEDAAESLPDAPVDEPANGEEPMQLDHGSSNAVILHEDKQYYPRAQEVYGDDVEIQVQEEDTQALSEPIIQPEDKKRFSIEETELPPTFYSRQYLNDRMSYPETVRNITIAGHLHHGKTAFMDMLVLETHDISNRLEKRRGRRTEEDLRYTDALFLERERGISIKSSAMTFLLPGTKHKNYVFNVLDTPGHINFVDEVVASCRMSDGLVLVVDVIRRRASNNRNDHSACHWRKPPYSLGCQQNRSLDLGVEAAAGRCVLQDQEYDRGGQYLYSLHYEGSRTFATTQP